MSRQGFPLRVSRVRAIAAREWRSTVRRREFVLVTLGLPIFYALLIAITIGASASAVGSARRKSEATGPAAIGYADGSRRLDAAALRAGSDGFAGVICASDAEGEDMVRQRKVRAFVVVPVDFVGSGNLTVYTRVSGDPLSGGHSSGDEAVRAAYTRTIRRAALAAKVDAVTLTWTLQPFSPDSRVLDSKTGKFAPPDPFREISRLAVPYAFSMLLLLSVMFSSSYLLHGIVEEKESRIIETLLSAVTHEELLVGKLIGLGGAGLTQLGVWLLAGLSLSSFAAPALRAALGSAIAPSVVLVAAVLFALGFGLYAAVFAGVGATGTSWRESQQIAGIGAFVLVMPLIFLPVILEDPNGTVARVVSLIPFTSPIGMMLRVAAGGGSPIDLAVCIGLLLLAIAVTIRLSARLFRLSLLSTGQRPGFAAVLRALTER